MSTKNLRQKNLFFLGLSGIFILLIISLSRGILDLLGTKDRFTRAEQTVSELEARNRDLKAEAEKSNQELVTEAIIRDELDLAKPGDIVVIIPEELLQSRINEQNQETEDQNIPNWQRWLQVFGF